MTYLNEDSYKMRSYKPTHKNTLLTFDLTVHFVFTCVKHNKEGIHVANLHVHMVILHFQVMNNMFALSLAKSSSLQVWVGCPHNNCESLHKQYPRTTVRGQWESPDSKLMIPPFHIRTHAHIQKKATHSQTASFLASVNRTRKQHKAQ